jgi:phosphatidate cytidylyltransferase
MNHLTDNTLSLLAAIGLALVIGTVVRVGGMAWRKEGAPTRLDSLATWWVLAVILGGAILLHKLAVVAVFAVASGLGVREFFALTGAKDGPRLRCWLFAVVVLQYVAVGLKQHEAFLVVIPVFTLLLVASGSIRRGVTAGYLREVGTTSWGMLVLVFAVSHAPMCLAFPESTNPVGGTMGWLLYLVLLTQTNDIAQALWGRRLGKHKVTPQISPHKTWEGLLLGALTTVVLAVVLGAYVTPWSSGPTLKLGDTTLELPHFWSFMAGVLIAVGGFLGDLNMSAVKRDLGTKDSGRLLPGQGGILDRIDSLTFTGPLFYYYLVWLYR